MQHKPNKCLNNFADIITYKKWEAIDYQKKIMKCRPSERMKREIHKTTWISGIQTAMSYRHLCTGH